ncbi:MAG: cupin domain-containing protein [Saprospiraceae bacterium]
MDYFIKKDKKEVETLDWGNLTRLSGPKKTNAKDLVVIEVNIAPGQGHDFHKHPKQEEVIYVVNGTVEQWVGQEKQILTAGESVFIPADMVHASFNVGDSDARLIAILGPSVGEDGYELVEVYEQAPWNALR